MEQYCHVATALIVASAVLGTAGLALLVLARHHHAKRRAMLEGSVVVEGEVLEWVEKHDGDDGVTYAPRVRYKAATGQVHEFESAVAWGAPPWRVGGKVPVRHRPLPPHDPVIDSFMALWGPAVACAGVGAFLLLLAGIAALAGPG